jgi:hypothetical protein
MYEIFSGLYTPENISYGLSINLRLPFSNLSKGTHACHAQQWPTPPSPVIDL